MTQEDGFIEVKCYLTNRTPILKWVRPVKTVKVKMLFDVFAMMSMSRDSGVNFADAQKMEPLEQLAWMVMGGMKSYAALKNKRLSITIEEVLEMVDGILMTDRMAIFETIKVSREVGEMAEGYQKAREIMSEKTGSKKAQGQVSGQQN